MYDSEHMDQWLIIYTNTFLIANRLQAVMDAELEEIALMCKAQFKIYHRLEQISRESYKS